MNKMVHSTDSSHIEVGSTVYTTGLFGFGDIEYYACTVLEVREDGSLKVDEEGAEPGSLPPGLTKVRDISRWCVLMQDGLPNYDKQQGAIVLG